jgi:(S)-ureidoglycine aminohydrolase
VTQAEGRAAFVDRLGHVAEGSPWVAERAWDLGPFPGHEAVAAAFARVVRDAVAGEQLALIRAHPDLAGRAALDGDLTPESAGEQASAGLDRLTPGDLARLTRLNDAYRARFGFPFVMRVRGRSVAEILDAYERRLANDADAERATAIEEIAQIIRLRLEGVGMSPPRAPLRSPAMSGPHARTTVRRDHAVIAPGTHVAGPVPGWSGTEHVLLVGPPMGARFTMALAGMAAGAVAGPPPAGAGRAVFVLEGGLALEAEGARHALGPGHFAYVPPDVAHALTAPAGARACVVDKPYVEAPGFPRGRLVTGDSAALASQPLLGDPALRVTQLLPEEPALDLALNLMTFDPGAALPFTETHVMEHGLLVLEGALVYRLGDAWYPLEAGDAVWMGPFCPQWCCAYGTGPATYLIYKDWNRDAGA